LKQNIENGERQHMMILQSDENETKVGGMTLIPKSIGNNGAIMELMKKNHYCANSIEKRS
jgi:hypothetical protein